MELDSFKSFLYLKEIAKNKFARFREKEGISQEEIDRAHADFEKLQALRKIPNNFNIQAKDFEGKPLTFKVLRDLLDVKLKEVEVKVKSKKDEYTLIEDKPDYLVIEPHNNPCVFEWAPKEDGDSVWCIGWKSRTQYFDKYINENGARYFLIIDKKENPNQAKYAFVPMRKTPTESQYRDYTNKYNVKSLIRNKVFESIPITKNLGIKQLGKHAYVLNYDYTSLLEIDNHPDRIVTMVSKNQDINVPNPDSPDNEFFCALLDETGNPLIPMSDYKSIDRDFDVITVTREDDTKAIVDWTTGKFVTDFIYSDENASRTNLIEVKLAETGLHGVINKQGLEIIPCLYRYVDIGDDVIKVKDKNDNDGYYSLEGKVIIKAGTYDFVGNFYSFDDREIAIVQKYVGEQENDNTKTGIIDQQGNLIIPLIYRGIGSFSKATKLAIAAIVVEDGTEDSTKVGVIDINNKIIIPFKYSDIDDMTVNNEEVFYVSENGKKGILSHDNQVIVPVEYSRVHSTDKDLFVVSKRVNEIDLYAIFKDGKELFPPKYHTIRNFTSKGFAKVLLDDNIGLINIKGKEIIPCLYEYLDINRDDGYMEVGKANPENDSTSLKALFDPKGKQISDFLYDDIGDFYNDLARVKKMVKLKNNKKALRYGFINKLGIEVIPCTHAFASAFDAGNYATVQNGKDKVGIIDKTGKQIIPYKYNNISLPTNGQHMFKVRNDGVGIRDKLGYVNAAGVEIIPCIYDYLQSFGSNDPNELIKGRIGDKYYEINQEGKATETKEEE
jgi:hypothetical protein